MTTLYPTALDAFSNPTPSTNQAASRSHSEQHGDLNDAVEAIQSTLGITGSPNFPGQLRSDLNTNGYGFGGAADPTRGGFFKDDEPTTKLHKFRDRVFFGDAVPYTGRRTSPYGGDWLSENGASYFIKNSQVAVLGDEIEGRYAFLAAARGGGIGGAFVILNENGAAGRAIYAEAMHKGTATASSAIEVAVTNYTTTDFIPSAYNMSGARGLYLAAFDGAGYVVGNAGTPVAVPTNPPAAAIDIAGYSTTATRWRKGIVFRNGGLYRGTGDGSAGEAVAIECAQGHAYAWSVSDGVRAGVLRCDVNAAGADVGILFGNNVVQLVGTGEFPIMEFVRDAAGAGAVNNSKFTSARTGINPKLSAQGSDINVGLDDQTKGNGSRRFFGQGGTSESLRLLFSAGSYVNYVTVEGAITTGVPTIASAGSDTNIDLAISPKGTGRIRTGYASAAATTPANFSAARRLEIKDSSGTVYYIPLATSTW